MHTESFRSASVEEVQAALAARIGAVLAAVDASAPGQRDVQKCLEGLTRSFASPSWSLDVLALARTLRDKELFLRHAAARGALRTHILPLIHTCQAIVTTWSPKLELHVRAEDLVPFDTQGDEPGSEAEVRLIRGLRQVAEPTAARLRAIADTLLWNEGFGTTHLSPALFQVECRATVEVEVFEDEDRDPASEWKEQDDPAKPSRVQVASIHAREEGWREARQAVEHLLQDRIGMAFVLWRQSDTVAVADIEHIRRRWTDLLDCRSCEDVFFVPPSAEWGITYFHHGTVEVGQRVQPWAHEMSLEA